MVDRVEAAPEEEVRAHAERVVAELKDQFPEGIGFRLLFPGRRDADAILQVSGPDLGTLDTVGIAAAYKIAALLDEEDIFIEVQSVLAPPAAESENGAATSS